MATWICLQLRHKALGVQKGVAICRHVGSAAWYGIFSPTDEPERCLRYGYEIDCDVQVLDTPGAEGVE